MLIRPMSALGQKQTCAAQKAMSALPPKADIRGRVDAEGTLLDDVPPSSEPRFFRWGGIKAVTARRRRLSVFQSTNSAFNFAATTTLKRSRLSRLTVSVATWS